MDSSFAAPAGPGTVIEIECQIEPREYVAAQYLHMRPRPVLAVLGIGLVLSFALVLGVSLVSLMRTGGDPVLPLIMLASGGYLAGFYFWFLPWRGRRLYEQHKALQTVFRMRVSEKGVFAENEGGQNLTPWAHVLKWKESGSLILIYHNAIMFQMIPKRCLRSEPDAEALRQLLTVHAKKDG